MAARERCCDPCSPLRFQLVQETKSSVILAKSSGDSPIMQYLQICDNTVIKIH